MQIEHIQVILLLALVLAIFIGFKFNINTGLVSIAFAFVLGFFVFEPLEKNPETLVSLSSAAAKSVTLIKGWPNNLFFILLGMTLLFSVAKVNNTLELLARKVAYLSKGCKKLLPVIFFLLSMILAAIGPGNIAVCALLLPIAMALSKEEKINPLLMAGVTIAGANAGGLSPISPTGIIAIKLAKDIGYEIGNHVFIQTIIAQIVLAVVLYLVLGGLKLKNDSSFSMEKPVGFDRNQKITLGVIFAVVIGIVFIKWNVGFAGFVGAFVLLFLKVADEKKTIAGVPWATLILVCGVGVLVNVVKIGGGIDLLTETLAKFMNERTSGAIITLMGGLMSSVSSASGVVMPTLIPTVPGLVNELGVDGKMLITGIVLGAHFVTNSPLSTLGALAMASAGENIDKAKFFNQLLILGFGGVLFGAILVFVGIVG
ncbi:MAG: SLC13 family permease [Filifactoraceae bacterium]